MVTMDPEQERTRLAAFYAGQIDGRLEKIAGQAYELTDVAREALEAELERRGLNVPLAERPSAPPTPVEPPPPPPVETGDDGQPEMRRLVMIRRFRDLPEALLAKGGLDSAGIDCVLADENVVRLDWFWSNLMGGVKLLVDTENAAAASEILSQPIPEHFDVSGVGGYEQPRCPSCGSLDVNFEEINPAAYLSMMVGLPIPFHRKAWRCHSCGVEWEVVDSSESTA